MKGRHGVAAVLGICLILAAGAYSYNWLSLHQWNWIAGMCCGFMVGRWSR